MVKKKLQNVNMRAYDIMQLKKVITCLGFVLHRTAIMVFPSVIARFKELEHFNSGILWIRPFEKQLLFDDIFEL